MASTPSREPLRHYDTQWKTAAAITPAPIAMLADTAPDFETPSLRDDTASSVI
jgi:hypothetical protein